MAVHPSLFLVGRAAKHRRVGESPAHLHEPLAGAEEPVAGVAEAGENVALGIELPVERRAVHHHVGVRIGKAPHSLGRRDEAEKTDAHGTGTLE